MVAKRKSKALTSKTPRAKTSPPSASPFTDDPRLPKAGSTIERTYKGKTLRVAVTEAGFRFESETYRSLSALARHITGADSINGMLWFGLAARPTPRTGAPRKRAPKRKPAPTMAVALAPTPTAPPKPTKGTPEQVASVAKARLARAAKVAARKAAKGQAL